MHPAKKKRFYKTYFEFKQDHYKKHYLKKALYNLLKKPHLTSELSIIFDRSFARISEVLVELKKEFKVTNYRVGSLSYWLRLDKEKIIISKLKNNYLRILNDGYMKTTEIAKKFKVTYKSSYKRLKELESLGLVQRDKNKNWRIIKQNQKVIVK